ncbi:hypothetical protein Srubr_15680 [Streptomyces rubradiris]|uniref:Uncharacterized protein n=1 Tax=Streptomyces rubradiris TaxID=285531 RepID=A0ABQ3R7B8_STRRR|nr:hypothetical protein GCM10018792_47120 [Streptomyces rubradiris]GHI51722.1 hypothetical protein Srubr_15680 [Streptomyces rubradiris]
METGTGSRGPGRMGTGTGSRGPGPTGVRAEPGNSGPPKTPQKATTSPAAHGTEG